MRVTTVFTTLALAATLGACGYPNPDAYPQTDRFVGVQGRVFGTPQAPQQNVYCYRTSSGVADCANQVVPSQEYRLVNAFVAAPPPPGVPSPASGGPVQVGPVQPGPLSPNVAPPPPIRQTQATPPAPPPGAQAPAQAPQAPLSLRPQGPAAAPVDAPPAAAPATPPAPGAPPPS